MKKLFTISAMAMLAVGCAGTPEQLPPKIGMANPASVYCVEQGGKLEVRDEPAGQVGYCSLPNGQVVEEWALFRASAQQCQAEVAQTLVGQRFSSVDALKAQTKLDNIRVLKPNQAATMDYRSDRLTVLLDDQAQNIVSANCG